MPILGVNRYGKRGVRLVKVTRRPEGCDLKEVSVDIHLEGDFESSFRTGNNSQILPTDSMKNAVYALARKHSLDPIENFGLELVSQLLAGNEQARRTQVALTEILWARVKVDGHPHPATFEKHGSETRTTLITGTRDRLSVSSGIDHLALLKTTDSAFEGFVWDRFTTLRETKDRLLCTETRAEWRYTGTKLPFTELWNLVLETLKSSFARHQSRSVQHTLFEMGQKVIAAISQIEEIYLAMPNKHCHAVDLAPLGLDNPNEIFMPVDEPFGFIEARITR